MELKDIEMRKMGAKFDLEEQRMVWDSIAKGWSGWRNKPRSDIIEFSKGWRPGRILDIGCGNGRNLIYFAEAGFDVYGIDLSKEMIKQARELFVKRFKEKGMNTRKASEKRILEEKEFDKKFIVADMCKLPFRDRTFDYCISIASFHHLPRERQKSALQEMKRVLKDDGECIISVWNKYSFRNLKLSLLPKETYIDWKRREGGKIKVYKRYYYLFNYFELKKLLEENGFVIKKSSRIFDENITFLIRKKMNKKSV